MPNTEIQELFDILTFTHKKPKPVISVQAPTLNDTGLRMRKLLDNGEYSLKQLWDNNSCALSVTYLHK